MKRLITMCLLIILMVVPCLGIQGSDVSLDKTNEDKAYEDSANSPVYQIDYQTISDARDPLQYEAPTRDFIPPNNNNNNNNNSNGNENSSSNPLRTVYFKMTGDINGTGTFNNWRTVYAPEKSCLRQSSSATKTGHISRHDIVSLIDENPGDNLNDSAIALLDHVDFAGAAKGASYREWGSYNNMGDLFTEYFTTRTILKDSVYIARTYRNLTQNEMYYPIDNYAVTSKSTIYNLTTGFTGSYGFEQQFENSSIISQEYKGGFVLRTKISNNVMFNLTEKSDHWLPCCQYDSNDIWATPPATRAAGF